MIISCNKIDIKLSVVQNMKKNHSLQNVTQLMKLKYSGKSMDLLNILPV